MGVPASSVEQLMDKIRHLPLEKISEVEDFVDFLWNRTQVESRADRGGEFEFPVVSVGQWPADLNLRREEMYGDDGR